MLLRARQQAFGRLNDELRPLVQQLIVDQFDEPRPDVMILRQPPGSRKPEARDCLVVIEVSGSTYRQKPLPDFGDAIQKGSPQSTPCWGRHPERISLI